MLTVPDARSASNPATASMNCGLPRSSRAFGRGWVCEPTIRRLRSQALPVIRHNFRTGRSAVATRWPMRWTNSQHVYEIRPRDDKHGVDLISDALPFGRLWYGEPNAISNAIDYARFRSRSHND
jgi:hypothetical protein